MSRKRNIIFLGLTCILFSIGVSQNYNVPGESCVLDNGEEGFLDCDLCCWDTGLLYWLGDGYSCQSPVAAQFSVSERFLRVSALN